MFSLLGDTTLFPATHSYTVEPCVQMHGVVPVNIPERDRWFYTSLPALVFDDKLRPTAQSASTLFCNCLFDRAGVLTHISPALLRFLCMCVDRTLFPQAEPNVSRILSAAGVPRLRAAPCRHSKPRLRALKIKSNDWECMCSLHRHEFGDRKIHPLSLAVCGYPVCCRCFRALFVCVPSGWYHIDTAKSFTVSSFHRLVLRPLRDRPLGHVLRGAVYARQRYDPVAGLRHLLTTGKQALLSPLGHYIESYAAHGCNTLAYTVIPSEGAHLVQKLDSWLHRKERDQEMHSVSILKNGATSIARLGRFEAPKGLKWPSLGAIQRCRRFLRNTDVFFGFQSDEDIVFMTRDCLDVLRAILFECSVDIAIGLVAAGAQVPGSVHPDDVCDLQHRDCVILREAHLASWGALHWAVFKVGCRSLVLYGEYEHNEKVETGINGICSIFDEFVDIAHVAKFGLPHFPASVREKVSFTLRPLDHRHRSETGRASDEVERTLWNTAKWLPAHLPRWGPTGIPNPLLTRLPET